MNVVLQGVLWGLGIGAFLTFVEYRFVKKAVEERAAAKHQKPEWEAQDRNRIKAVITFSVCLPPAFALGAWLIWG